jgi:hypothetical protein
MCKGASNCETDAGARIAIPSQASIREVHLGNRALAALSWGMMNFTVFATM